MAHFRLVSASKARVLVLVLLLSACSAKSPIPSASVSRSVPSPSAPASWDYCDSGDIADFAGVLNLIRRGILSEEEAVTELASLQSNLGAQADALGGSEAVALHRVSNALGRMKATISDLGYPDYRHSRIVAREDDDLVTFMLAAQRALDCPVG